MSVAESAYASHAFAKSPFDTCLICGMGIEQNHEEGWPFPCCDHCGCGTPTGHWKHRTGHDDSCIHGCNETTHNGGTAS